MVWALFVSLGRGQSKEFVIDNIDIMWYNKCMYSIY